MKWDGLGGGGGRCLGLGEVYDLIWFIGLLVNFLGLSLVILNK